jgi:hypothetical protein
VNTLAGAAQVDGGKANEHGNGGNHFEVNQRLDAEAPDFFQIRMTGNPHHENGEE